MTFALDSTEFTTPGDNTWVCPASVTIAYFTGIGSGSAGDINVDLGTANAGLASGGAGEAVWRFPFPTTPLATYTVHVGAAGTRHSGGTGNGEDTYIVGGPRAVGATVPDSLHNAGGNGGGPNGAIGAGTGLPGTPGALDSPIHFSGACGGGSHPNGAANGSIGGPFNGTAGGQVNAGLMGTSAGGASSPYGQGPTGCADAQLQAPNATFYGTGGAGATRGSVGTYLVTRFPGDGAQGYARIEYPKVQP